MVAELGSSCVMDDCRDAILSSKFSAAETLRSTPVSDW